MSLLKNVGGSFDTNIQIRIKNGSNSPRLTKIVKSLSPVSNPTKVDKIAKKFPLRLTLEN